MPPKAKAAGVKKPRAPRATGAHKLPDPLPAGEILRDYCKKEWKLGKPIGAGGFGLIYLADMNSPGAVSENSQYVMKLEPHSNGPLFCELHFYQRVAKADYISEWTQSKKMKHLGVPKYIASGSHENGGTKYRFMVMERCGTDLQKVFEANGKSFPEKTVYMLGIHLLHALEYVHEKDYVHADIKASNILTGFGRDKSGQIYLVDYGLAFRYSCDGKHKDYKEDPKRLHDGTIEFTSRDAHRGVVPSRRGDLEILGYCLLQWLCHTLPWEDNLNNKEYVRDSKNKHMKNIGGLLKKCLPTTKHDELSKFLQYSVDLEYAERPDYNKCRQWLRQALKRLGGSESDKLVLSMAGPSSPRKPAAKATKKRKNEQEELPPSKYLASDSESDSDFEIAAIPKARGRKPSTPKATPKATPKSSAARAARVKSPRSTTPSAGRKRVNDKGEVIPMPAVPPPALVNGRSSTPGSRVQAIKKKVALSSTATQTSPGLKGLQRSRNKKRS